MIIIDYGFLPLTCDSLPSSSPPVNVREFCLVIFSHATTLPSHRPTLSMSMMRKVKMKVEEEEW